MCRSTDGGSSWVAENCGLTRSSAASLAAAGNGVIFTGTLSGGVFRTTQSTTGADEIDGTMPEGFVLRQNYPNPFNPITVIRFELPVASDVRLSVCDLLGREVAVLVSEREVAGMHSVRFDGHGLASGVYLYRLRLRPLDSAVGPESVRGEGT